MLLPNTAQQVHRAHTPGATAQAKLGAALQVRADLRQKLQAQAQVNLAAGASMLSQAAALVGGEAGALLGAAAQIAVQARASLALGTPPELALVGQVVAGLPNPTAAQALPHLIRAAGVLALKGGEASGSARLALSMVSLAARASGRGMDFQLGVAWPLARGMALRGGVEVVEGRRLEARLGFAARLQARLGG
ncbi:hypothetical protein KZX47_12800 [Thermus sp. SYSU G05001]|uniref:Uncharacterized protein n=1 Tax=Thermus brevis TaxID=2862456 RepID=A0ABS7A1I8_9DEIN|nr:hypothetical protein [Thermus brevis]MBW6396023.1 hypothetical protein [Thermus brevis]